MYRGGDYDLAGFAVGAAERGALLPAGVARARRCSGWPAPACTPTASRWCAGSSRAATPAGTTRRPSPPGRPWPRRCWSRRASTCAVLALHRAGLLRAAAHITGGGLPGNLPRVLPGTRTRCWTLPLAAPPVMAWLAQRGGVAPDEMLRVFNCGIGMALVVEDAPAATALLQDHGETVFAIGRIEAADGPATVALRVRLRMRCGEREALLRRPAWLFE